MEETIKENAFRAVKAAEDKKAKDIQLLEVSELTIIADYFVICSGNTERQVEAIARGIEEELAEKDIFPQRIAGKEDARWILLDYADFIVHVFHHEEREYYELERLWADAEKLLAEKEQQ
ncbi:MAG: ribosome silencing factor [Bacillota bacterium]